MEPQRTTRKNAFIAGIGLVGLVGLPGCLASHGWVTEQLRPVREQVGQLNSELKALEAQVATLRLERRVVGNLQEGLNFATGSAELTTQAKAKIDEFLGGLDGAGIKDVNFFVAGYTDSQGSERYNYDLGQHRATRVAQYLITQRGIEPARITTASHGKSNPLAANVNPAGRYLNRRVSITAYKEVIVSATHGNGAPATPSPSETTQPAPNQLPWGSRDNQ